MSDSGDRVVHVLVQAPPSSDPGCWFGCCSGCLLCLLAFFLVNFLLLVVLRP